MKLANLLNEKNIILQLNGGDCQDSVPEILNYLVSVNTLSASLLDEMQEAVFAREDQVSTGIGSGVAIPHAFSDSIDEVVVAFARSTEGVEFESLDNALVHFIVMFLVPEEKRNTHLQTLAAVAKAFKTCGIREQLMNAVSEAEVISILESCND